MNFFQNKRHNTKYHHINATNVEVGSNLSSEKKEVLPFSGASQPEMAQ